MTLPWEAAVAEAALGIGIYWKSLLSLIPGWMSSTSQSFQSTHHRGVVRAGSGPYGLMGREDLALSINPELFQELWLPGLSLPGAHTLLPGPDGLQKAPKCACN